MKREPNGVASNFMHDKLQVGATVEAFAPCGDFVLTDTGRPLVLLTGGVGITPAISMLNATASSGRRIDFIHAALNGRVHAFREHVDAIAEQHDNVRPFYLYDQADASDTPHARGLISAELLRERLQGDHDVDLYFLGPKPFMRAVYGIARELGIPEAQVRYEFFGPLEALSA